MRTMLSLKRPNKKPKIVSKEHQEKMSIYKYGVFLKGDYSAKSVHQTRESAEQFLEKLGKMKEFYEIRKIIGW